MPSVVYSHHRFDPAIGRLPVAVLLIVGFASVGCGESSSPSPDPITSGTNTSPGDTLATTAEPSTLAPATPPRVQMCQISPGFGRTEYSGPRDAPGNQPEHTNYATSPAVRHSADYLGTRNATVSFVAINRF